MTAPIDAASQAEAETWSCPSCYKSSAPEVVPVRRDRNEGWVESTIRQCRNCKYTFGGTLADRLVHVNCVYEYKYFGDYELSDEQKDAVGEMIALANLVPKLTAQLSTRDQTVKELADLLRRALPVISKDKWDDPLPISREIKRALDKLDQPVAGKPSMFIEGFFSENAERLERDKDQSPPQGADQGETG
jgi:hypothetical protein